MTYQDREFFGEAFPEVTSPDQHKDTSRFENIMDEFSNFPEIQEELINEVREDFDYEMAEYGIVPNEFTFLEHLLTAILEKMLSLCSHLTVTIEEVVSDWTTVTKEVDFESFVDNAMVECVVKAYWCYYQAIAIPKDYFWLKIQETVEKYYEQLDDLERTLLLFFKDRLLWKELHEDVK